MPLDPPNKLFISYMGLKKTPMRLPWTLAQKDLTNPPTWPILFAPQPKWRNGIRGGLKNHWRLLRVGSNPTFGIIVA